MGILGALSVESLAFAITVSVWFKDVEIEVYAISEKSSNVKIKLDTDKNLLQSKSVSVQTVDPPKAIQVEKPPSSKVT